MHWLEIALQHARAARAVHDVAVEARCDSNEPQLLAAVLDEFHAALQSLCASCFAVESLWYDLLDQQVVPEKRQLEWATAHTARPQRIWHTIDLASRLPGDYKRQLRTNLKVLFHPRNQAVHPHHPFREPLLHPELQIALDQTYIEFRYVNALAAFSNAVELLARTVIGAKARGDEFARWVDDACGQLLAFIDDTGIKLDSPEDLVGQLRGAHLR